MVTRVYPNSADFENLSRLRTEISDEANLTDFSRVVVVKPWGYEYLWLQTASVAIWMLHLRAEQATSLHCHARKRTSLVVMSGEVLCSTIEDRHRLRAGEAVVLEPCVFHSTRALSPAGAVVMEVENPPLKGDLLRYRDDFGRAGRAYEKAHEHATDLAVFDYRPRSSFPVSQDAFRFHDVSLRLAGFRQASELAASIPSHGLVIPCLGRLVFGREIVADTGEAIAAARLGSEPCPAAFPPVELLHILPLSPNNP